MRFAILILKESDFFEEAKKFLSTIFSQVKSRNLNIQHWPIDHICYRTETLAQYKTLKLELNKFAKLLIESEVNGRLISTYKLEDFIYFEGKYIDLIELPAPKTGSPYQLGFEHIEFIADVELEELPKKYSNLKFKTKGLNKNFNRELELSLDNGAIKFHNQSLESVINLEANTKVFNALKNSNILNLLKELNPLVAGTFPLDLHNQDSDLDIIVKSYDFTSLTQLLKNNFIHNNLNLKIDEEQNLPSLTANFDFQDVKFEIFAQPVPSTQQRAFKHFQVEEQILKFGGNVLKNKIQNLRSLGLKTEPAFAKQLNIDGDPYSKLLDLKQYSEDKLRSII